MSSSTIDKQPAAAQSSKTASSAAASVQYLCRLLRSHGVCQLTPEILRQAKFDQPQALQPLLCALHDLALVALADFPPNCAENLQWLKQQLQQENTQPALDSLPAQGHLLLLHSLSSWGCPASLVAQLSLPVLSSRAALLALGWLVAHTELFDRALQQLQIPVHLLPLLPPYPEDAALTHEAQQHHATAAAATQQHHQHIQQLLQQQQHHHHHQHRASQAGASSGGSRADGSCWSAVQTAAHHVLKTYRAAHLRLQQLTCLAEAREKLLHAIKQVQQQQQQQQQPVASQRPGHAEPSNSCLSGSSRGSRHCLGDFSGTPSGQNGKHPRELTAFELHLAAHPEKLQQHKVALCQATSLLQQQEDCRLHAQTFFAWATSAIAPPPEHSQPQQKLHRDPPAARQHGRDTTHAISQERGQQQGSQLPEPHVLRTASPQDLVALAESLPPADSQLAANLLQRLSTQLEQAAQVACRGELGRGAVDCLNDAQASHHSAPATTAVEAATAALPGPQAYAYVSAAHTSTAGGQHAAVVSPAGVDLQQRVDLKQHAQAAAVALLQAGVVLDADIEELRDMPADVVSELQRLRVQESASRDQQLNQLEALKDGKQWSATHRRRIDVPQAQQQQQQQQQLHRGHKGISEGGVVCMGQEQPRPSKGQEHAAAVDAACAAQGLSALALHVAKQLAKARARNKQQLAAAAELLLHAGEGVQEGQFVLYQT